MQYAYITLLSTDNYLEGVLVLNESLKLVNSKYKLVVLVTSQVSHSVENTLNRLGIPTIRKEMNILPSKKLQVQNERVGYNYWNNTFDCLLVFDLIEFDKIVFLDSDMMVIENIDELFDKPHMSAVKDPGSDVLNSGTFVAVPEAGLVDKILSVLPIVEKEEYYFGDQTVLQYYYKDWPNKKELHLDEKYNAFVCSLHWFINSEGYRINGLSKNLCVIHFVGPQKPWMFTDEEIAEKFSGYIKDGNPYAIQMTRQYLYLLKQVNDKLNSLL